ncbi:hypothetical protein AHMF7605_16650 [Adhaeribacter arboris]|uniref:Uncharacterized protein n=1 Tax=Adhaeribacter arboris TaxID=2072846 RepID=A0A2T2YHN3_9BACT|nr:UPF0175 family protein [Adhaeribacter arboris]PSR55017.1 hypothetical protein AHMF7605_16650 [Adhaeribacter arboris]
MRTLTIHIPDSVDLEDREMVMFLASRLYEKSKLSLGQAAEIAGLSKRAFMEVLGHYVSLFNYDESELEKELMHVKNYRK